MLLQMAGFHSFYGWLILLYVCVSVCTTSFFFFLISHQFYTHQCIHVNPNHPIQHTTIPTPPRFSPVGVHTFVLYICVSTSALQSGLYHIFFIHSSVDGHLGCFHILAVVMLLWTFGVCVSFRLSVFVFFRYKTRSGISC